MVYDLADLLAHNCPNDVKNTDKGQYGLHFIELHCNWYAAITFQGEIIEERIYMLKSDKGGYDYIMEKWEAI